jgi:hypothetical protein
VTYASRQDSLRAKADTAASRVGIDLFAVLHDPRSVDNLLLEDGDSLDVPPMHATVEVKGFVNAPTVVALAPGQKLEHYVRAAGGPDRRRAEPDGAYVIQPNGKIESRHRIAFFWHSDPTPRPGATIIMPARDTLAPPGQALQTFTIVTSLLATLLTAAVVLK